MTKSKEISLQRVSSLVRREEEHSAPKNKTPSKLAADFITRNEKGDTRVFVAGGSRSGNDPLYEQEAFKLGEVIGKMNYRLDFGLSSRGIMGAVAKGMLKAWSESGKRSKSPIYGITTKEYLALYKSDKVLDEVSEIVVANTLEERKQQLLCADLVIFAPGGVGTLDELVYDAVAMQDGFLGFKPFVLFNVGGFFHHLLEYLKEINLKGFSDPLPFLVVDNSLEAGIAFKVLEYSFATPPSDKNAALELMEKIIYELPYVLLMHQKYPKKSIEKILMEKAQIEQSNSKSKKEQLASNIENAYLNKEIERMYERLAKSGMDTATVSKKLTALKMRHIKG